MFMCVVCHKNYVHSKCAADRSKGAPIFCSSPCQNQWVEEEDAEEADPENKE
jgi:hypothetical protein